MAFPGDGMADNASSFARHSKRSRQEFQADQDYLDDSIVCTKRPARLLPIRQCSVRLAESSINYNRAEAAERHLQIPTPIESSDEDIWDLVDSKTGYSGMLQKGASPTTNQSSFPIIKAQATEHEDLMDVISSGPSRSLLDPYSPPGSQHRTYNTTTLQSDSFALSNSQSPFTKDRIPTPVAQRFGRDADIAMTGSARLPPLRTILSPMLGDDSPETSKTGLPSPAADDEPMEMSPNPHASLMLENLNLKSAPSYQTQPQLNLLTRSETYPSSWHRPPPYSSDSKDDRSVNRTARLQMGFRADCEKCRQHVPGHYSHIIWS